LTDYLLQKGNPWLAANGYISFDRAPDSNGVIWGNLPDIKPFIKSVGVGSDNWLFAGLLPDTNNAATPPPDGMIQDVLHRTNLVYYDWEVTGPRLQPDLQPAQTARQLLRQPQLPLDSASLTWLGMLIPRLGTSATIISRTGPAELTFYPPFHPRPHRVRTSSARRLARIPSISKVGMALRRPRHTQRIGTHSTGDTI